MANQLVQEIIKFGKIAGEKGYTPGISGNVSVRCDEGILITASGSANGYLEPEDVVLIDLEGNVAQGSKKASTEKFLHLEFYKKRPDVNSVFHVHSPYLTAFASSHTALMDGVSPEIIYCFGEIPLADYALPGSEELVENTVKYFDRHDVVLLANHGVIVGAKDLKNAYYSMETVEAYAQIYLNSMVLGGAKELSQENIEDIYKLRKLMGR